jgi:hypothetical protein
MDVGYSSWYHHHSLSYISVGSFLSFYWIIPTSHIYMFVLQCMCISVVFLFLSCYRHLLLFSFHFNQQLWYKVSSLFIGTFTTWHGDTGNRNQSGTGTVFRETGISYILDAFLQLREFHRIKDMNSLINTNTYNRYFCITGFYLRNKFRHRLNEHLIKANICLH